MPRARLIFNPGAGRFTPEPVVRLAVDTLQNRGWTIEVAATRNAAHVTELAAQTAREGLDTLLVAGGDGSISLAVAGLAGSRTALGILPTGTANVLAKQMHLSPLTPLQPDTIVQAALLLADSLPRTIDTGTCNGNAFLLWAGVGFDAMIVSKAEAHRAHWKKRLAVPEYFVRALWSAHRWAGVDCTIHGLRADGKTPVHFSGPAQIVVASNIPLYAGGLVEISPDAKLDDAEMDLWLFKGRGIRRFLRHAWNLFRGIHVQDPNVVHLMFHRATIRTGSPTKIHTDGNPHHSTSEVLLETQPGSVQLLVPPSAAERLFTR